MAGKGKPKSSDTEEKDANETLFCITGSLKIEDQKVPIVAKTGDDTLIELTRPAKLGNALTVGTWLNNTWATPVDILLVNKPAGPDKQVASQSKVTVAQVKANLGSLPEQAKETVAKLLLADVWVTDLYIRSWKEGEDADAKSRKAFKFGITIDFTGGKTMDGIDLLPNIKLLDVGLVITNAPKKYEFPAHKLLPVPEPVDLERLELLADTEPVELEKPDAPPPSET